MKNITLTLLILTFFNCKSQSKSIPSTEKPIELNNVELNLEINKSQLKSIEFSPFASSKSMEKELKTQLIFRKKYIDAINQIRKEYPKNPLILLENYDFTCTGCPAYYVVIFNNEILISYQLDSFQNKTIDDIKYIEKEKLTDFDNMFNDLKIIYKNLNLKAKWNSNPAEYGVEYGCSDGSKSFYSVFFPDSRIESMYMRCWTAEFNKQN